jgi:hypothetical protein
VNIVLTKEEIALLLDMCAKGSFQGSAVLRLVIGLEDKLVATLKKAESKEKV